MGYSPGGRKESYTTEQENGRTPLGEACSAPSPLHRKVEDLQFRVEEESITKARAVAAVSRFPSRGSRNLWLSLESFP